MTVGDGGTDTEPRGYFAAMVAGSFKLDPQGHQLFFPWGTLGRGYVVPSTPEHERLSKTVNRLSKASLIAVIVVGALVQPPWLVFLVLPPWCLGYLIWVRRTTRGWPPAAERLSLRESLAAQSRALGRPLLWALLLGSLLFVVAGTWLLAVRPDEWFTSTAAILFFGFCTAMYARMLFPGDVR